MRLKWALYDYRTMVLTELAAAALVCSIWAWYETASDRHDVSNQLAALQQKIQEESETLRIVANRLEYQESEEATFQGGLLSSATTIDETFSTLTSVRTDATQLKVAKRQALEAQQMLSSKADTEDLKFLGSEITTARDQVAVVTSRGLSSTQQAMHETMSISGQVRSVRDLGGADLVPSLVYNVIVSPSNAAGSSILEDGVRTTIRFFVGPRGASTGLAAGRAEKSASQLAAGLSAYPLTVTMNCLVCAANSVQKQDIIYVNGDSASGEAVFAIVPVRDLARQSDGAGHIVFGVSSRGIEFDHLPVAVTVEKRTASSVPNRNQSPSTFAVPEQTSQPDVVFTVNRIEGRIDVQVQAIHPKIQKLLNALGTGVQNDRLNFIGGSLDPIELQDLSRSMYEDLRALSAQEHDLVEKRAKVAGADTFRLTLDSAKQLTPDDRAKALATFYKLGNHLYRKLFTTNSNLRLFMNAFENVKLGRPARVVVETGTLFIPWQLLHPEGDLDANKFWGFKYELAVMPQFSLYQGNLPEVLSLAANDSAVFAAYGVPSDLGTGPREIGESQARFLEDKLKRPGLPVVHSKGELTDTLKKYHGTLGIFVAYLHASSGMVYVRSQNGVLAPVPDGMGPRLIFKPDDIVRPTDIFDLAANYVDQGPFFASQPFVFLNACETGTPVVESTPREDLAVGELFQNDFFELGARGMIVTESPIDQWFAYHFGQKLTEELLMTGTNLAKAILDVRKDLLEAGNPLGLLYAYYGNPSARFAISKEVATAK